jgi:hypothetical protein
MNLTHWKYALFALAAWVGLAGAASCLSSDDAPAGGHVEHPQPRAPMPVVSAQGAQEGSPPPTEGRFTPLDQAIADDCDRPKDMPWKQGRPWSENVPDRDCTNDGECGDGFCDRGHCAAIWTCRERYGQRCVNGRTVPNSRDAEGERCLCLDGRCRSCQSDAECEQWLGQGKGFACAGRTWPGYRYCGVLASKVGIGGHDMGPPPR